MLESFTQRFFRNSGYVTVRGEDRSFLSRFRPAPRDVTFTGVGPAETPVRSATVGRRNGRRVARPYSNITFTGVGPAISPTSPTSPTSPSDADPTPSISPHSARPAPTLAPNPRPRLTSFT
ncbi:hypothetical protein BOTBODRAFT_35271 [Botryobasidium botryosum FD-172 SS1]|uniref:Uncharacterized protein n=1 Tax=Botryobasidium botryosum (strain FD-172 SS1) TaxID=930990 RepID=A0A067MA77_BOTB1|nr:hypothetical protein BOTBODRAFT_35271 [Botryobasidium botryosum FD-172 SS1]